MFTEGQIPDIIKPSKAAMKKASDRFFYFQEKAEDKNGKFSMDKLNSMINLRTKKTNNLEKLVAWFLTLEDQNFHDEAEIVWRKIKSMGYNGPL